MISETFMLLFAFIGGLLLGAFFYGGLWWTVQRGLTAQRPAVWFFTSYLLRTGLTAAGLYGLAGGRWQRLLVSLLGCLLARFIVMRQSKAAGLNNLSRRPGHAA
jgi:F1F0 ATPase subunit 2